ncbi:hypothetical protein D3P96_02940 [Weissella viridescens]|uniref:Uncharacterized protein n=1 Tax=Weissella viridescens TaxID=1629 RepID=A0A3P2RLB1_WEIVI|nr:hypothetical protein [Weissella viridescens]RRG18258.1 hypothetical protein D3P96_02940 [Weissella viridescens]
MRQVNFYDIFNSDDRKQRLKILDIDGRIFEGYFDGQTDAFDNDPEVDTIELELDNGRIVTFPESDIKTIELID